jgi:hypothetical protein
MKAAISLLVLAITSASVAYSAVGNDFELWARTYLTSFPVPSFRPTQPGKVIAVDAFPSQGAQANPDNGFAWFDACDADLMDAFGDVPVTCARMGIKPDRVEFGSRSFDGGVSKDIYIVRDRQVIARFDASGLTVFGEVKARSFANIR